MARTDKFRQQHVELQSLVSELEKQLNPLTLAQDASSARSILSKLIGKLTLHLSAEDKILYPDLMASSDSKVSALAKTFANEMKSTASVVVAYNQKWSTASVIKANPNDFIKESKKIITALDDRIKRENNQLYAIADKSIGIAY